MKNKAINALKVLVKNRNTAPNEEERNRFQLQIYGAMMICANIGIDNADIQEVVK